MSKNVEDWKDFENEVAALFKLQGYNVRQNILISGKKVDIFAQKRVSQFTKENLAIECKFYTSKLPTEEVKEVIGTVPALIGTGKCDHVVIVSNSRPSEQALQLIEDTKNLNFMTYEQLLDGLIDFTPYIWKFMTIFESNELLKSYIPAMAHKQNNTASFDLVDLVNKLIKENKHFNLSILGDYGMGKTSVATMLTYDMMKKFKENPSINPIPIYIPLRDYSKSFDVRSMITDHLVNAYALHTDYSAFRMLLEKGKLLVILDGFDEMSQNVDSEVRRQHFLALADLFQGESKTIITGRLGYFPSREDLMEMTSLIGGHIVNEKLPKNNFVVFIEPFSADQITDYIKKRANYLKERGISKWTGLRDLIINSRNLSDLCSRPFLLSMVVKTAPIFKDKLTDLNTVGLYKEYTQMWLDRDYEKGEFRRLLNQEIKENMMEELALEMFSQGVKTFEIERLRANIKPIAERLKIPVIDKQFEYVEHDIRVCSFLTMDYKENCYRFAHQSFFEFFVARALLRMVRNGLMDDNLTKHYITDEILNFLAEMIETEGESQNTTETINALIKSVDELRMRWTPLLGQ